MILTQQSELCSDLSDLAHIHEVNIVNGKCSPNWLPAVHSHQPECCNRSGNISIMLTTEHCACRHYTSLCCSHSLGSALSYANPRLCSLQCKPHTYAHEQLTQQYNSLLDCAQQRCMHSEGSMDLSQVFLSLSGVWHGLDICAH